MRGSEARSRRGDARQEHEDVSLVLYPGARHEVLNETGREALPRRSRLDEDPDATSSADRQSRPFAGGVRCCLGEWFPQCFAFSFCAWHTGHGGKMRRNTPKTAPSYCIQGRVKRERKLWANKVHQIADADADGQRIQEGLDMKKLSKRACGPWRALSSYGLRAWQTPFAELHIGRDG